MSLPHILLGMLREPATGYDLGKRFKQSLAHFWHADLAQIYPTLKKLEQQGLLKSKPAPAEGGPPRRVYTRTAKGRHHLQSWLIEGPDVGKERIAHLAQTYFLQQLDDLELARDYFTDLRTYYEGWHKELKAIQALADEEIKVGGADDYRRFPYFTIRNGVIKTAASVAWCDECLEALEKQIHKNKL